jgi:CheY-like chemotaxis protein
LGHDGDVRETGDISLTPNEEVGNSPALRCRVIVADDSTDLRDLFVLLLDDEDDFTVIGAAADGAEAVHLADVLKPDLLVLDVNMPVMDGIEALRRVKAAQPHVRVVLLSAFPRGVLDRRVGGAPPLEAADRGDTHAADQIGILAVGLFDASPARVARHVHHWRKH